MVVTEAPIQVIPHQTADDKEDSAKAVQTIGSVVYFYEICFKFVPDSFAQGMADCAAGRTVDMEIALSQTPPDRGV